MIERQLQSPVRKCAVCNTTAEGSYCMQCGSKITEEITEVKICPHCKTPGTAKLCGECGENLNPARITTKQLFNDIPDVFDIEYGLLYTIRTFFTRPGKEIKEYFAGDRKKHYKPLKFIIFIGGVITFLNLTFNINNGKPVDPLAQFEADWGTAIFVFQFPIVAFFTYIIFKRRNYTYGEHLIANAYLVGEVLLYHIVLFPLSLLLNGTHGITTINLLYFLWIPVYFTYAYYDWFYDKKTASGFFKSLAVTVAVYVTTMVITVIFEFLVFYGLLRGVA